MQTVALAAHLHVVPFREAAGSPLGPLQYLQITLETALFVLPFIY